MTDWIHQNGDLGNYIADSPQPNMCFQSCMYMEVVWKSITLEHNERCVCCTKTAMSQEKNHLNVSKTSSR